MVSLQRKVCIQNLWHIMATVIAQKWHSFLTELWHTYLLTGKENQCVKMKNFKCLSYFICCWNTLAIYSDRSTVGGGGEAWVPGNKHRTDACSGSTFYKTDLKKRLGTRYHIFYSWSLEMKKIIFRFKPKQTETRSVSGLFRFVSWNQKIIIFVCFGLFRCFKPISKQPKQTELFRTGPKQPEIVWKNPKDDLSQTAAEVAKQVNSFERILKQE